MPALWTPRGTVGPPLSANDIGQQALPLMQPSFTPTSQVARAGAMQVNPAYATSDKAGRPYADVGKMSLNLANPGTMGQSAVHAQGFLEGFGSGAGRLIGGFVGQGQAGADIGQAIGGVGQFPLDIAAHALGAIPAIPGFPGSGMGTFGLGMTPEQQKQAIADAQGNPFAIFRMLGGVSKEDWQKRIDSGEVSPIFRSLGGADSLGDQVMNTLGLMGIGSQLLARGWAGGPGGRIHDVMTKPMNELSPEVQALRQKYEAKQLNDNQFLDALATSGAGYSDNWVVNLVAEMVLDPANLLFGAGAAVGLASKAAKAEQAMRFVTELGGRGAVEAKTLAESVSRKALETTGEAIPVDSVTPLQMLNEAQQVGSHGAQIAQATSTLDAQTRLALHPGFAKMQGVAEVANQVLNPFMNIGGGAKPLENAYLSREAVKGVAQHFDLNNFSAVSDRMESIGLGQLFRDGMGYFSAQEGLLIAGDNLKNDVQHIRRVSSVRPTDVALQRAKVGAANYAQQMDRWLSKRSADLARLTGGTKEEAMARATSTAQDKLIRMGASAEQATMIIKGLDEKGLNMIDALYFGHRIKTYNAAMRAARESIAAKIQSGIGVEATQAIQKTVDRLTLIGPRELTFERAQSLKAAIAEFEATGSEAALTSIRDAVRQYDRLALEHLADGTSGAELAAGVKSYLKEFEDQLTHEIDPATLDKLPGEIVTDATRGDGYIYGLRPADGQAEWRLAFDEAGNIKHANPWIDIVGDAAQPWNLRFRGDSTVGSFANAIERAGRFMGQQITTDRIDREARRAFVERAMTGWKKPVEGAVGGGLTYRESATLYQAIKDRALEASTTPRGLMIHEFNDVIKASPAAQRVGMSATDLQLLSLHAFEGNVGTVGLSQKLTGRAKVLGTNIPLLPGNTLGMVAERMYPLVRFGLNPFFQLQEWVEPWVFSWARGEPARMARGWLDPITGERVTLDRVDLIQQHLIERYKAANPESQFDMMERSLTYLYGQKAAKEAAAATDQNMLGQALARIRGETTAGRKHAASSAMFQYFLGPQLKSQFDKINPNIWLDLEREFGTKDAGQIATRWLVEKDAWASADPRVAYHLMDINKEAQYGARAAVNLEENAKVAFKTTREALNIRVGNGTLGFGEFADTLRELGAHETYIDNAWKATQFEVKTGGVDKFWEDAIPLTAGGAREVKATRDIVQALAEVHGITETELLSRTLQRSPVSLLHDDLISATERDLAAWGTLLQRGQELVAHMYNVDGVTGAVTRNPMLREVAEKEFLAQVAAPPDFLFEIPGMLGNTANMEKVAFRDAKGVGRDVFIPGGLKALKDIETPWTAWEAHVIRAQVLNPKDMIGNELKHALDEKMWRGHMFDMTDPANVHKVFNNYVFAMHSAQMSLTRNELVSSRFRAASIDDITHLADQARAFRSVIEAATGKEAEPGELGLAYSTNHDVAHYVPLDARHAYYERGMLPDRVTTVKVGGKLVEKPVKATQSLIEERAQVAKGYLEDTSRAQRDLHGKLTALQDEHRASLSSQKAREAYKPPDRLEHWGIDQLAGAFNDGVMNAAGERVIGADAIDLLPQMLGLKRAAKYTPEQINIINEAAGKLAQDPLDLEARNALRPYVTKMKGHDGNVIFKNWNVNGAGAPAGHMAGDVFGHGDKELFAYLKNDDVAWRSTGTNGNIGRTLVMAEDVSAHPEFYARRTLADGTLEPLDQFGERISHRISGLRLKTGFFGTDLGNPLEFNKGVHDIHMVGDLTEWMFDRTKKGTTQEWRDWLGSLSKDKQKLIGDWIDKGALHGAGVFKWKEAEGIAMNFKPGARDAIKLEGSSVAEKAAWVRARIDKAVASTSQVGAEQRDRLYQMYRTDAELADLVGRDIHTFGGDYKVFEDTMTKRKAIDTKSNPWLDRHGNGGYQWKLWDERRHVWDPETTAFDTTHGMQGRSLRYMAASDDVHNLAGFYNELGQPSVEQAGYSFLDPVHTVLTQQDANVIRGATISLDTGEKIIGLTKYRNRTTFLHEITHAVIEPLLDPSGRQVIIDDLNRVIDGRNAELVAGGGRYEAARTAVEDAANAVNDATTAAAEAKAAHIAAGRHAATRQTLDAADKELRAAKAAHVAATKEFNDIATAPLEAIKTGWDRQTSEHMADEFGRWLATGKATNPKLRDTFAYFRNVLLKVKTWLDGQPGQKVSPEVQQLFEELTTPKTAEQMAMANAVPFDATQEMMHAAGTQAVVNAEQAAFENVQFKRSRSWLERSLNHPYFGIYPASYMWGKVAPEIVRGLAVNPFGLPIPLLTKPVKIGAHEYGLHGSPFYGFVNAQRVWNSVEMQKTSDPSFNAQFSDPKNQQVWSNVNMFLPATPWDIPANFSLWMRRVAEWGLQSQQAAATGAKQPGFDLAKTAGEVSSYAFGLKATADWVSQTSQVVNAPMITGKPPAGAAASGVTMITPQMLMVAPQGTVPLEQRLQNAQQQLQSSLGK